MPTALITGSAKRIGRSLALHLLKKGWSVVIHYNASCSDAHSIALKLSQEENKRLKLVSLNFSDQNCDFSKLLSTAKEPVSLLINNAAVFKNDSARSLDIEVVRNHIEVNLIAPMILSSLFLKQDFGDVANPNIINMLDCNASAGHHNFCSYYLTKLALAEFTKTSAKQLAPKIRVNGIAIGYSLKNEQQSQENFENLFKTSVLGKVISCYEIANTIDFILQTKSITGEIINLGI